jgi:predicted nucleic-acid-binding Zn-ribbon protein
MCFSRPKCKEIWQKCSKTLQLKNSGTQLSDILSLKIKLFMMISCENMVIRMFLIENLAKLRSEAFFSRPYNKDMVEFFSATGKNSEF